MITVKQMYNLTKEKNEAINALQKQSVINDQQRSYIDILKNTLESSFIKNGIKISANSLNEVIDISQFIMENEKIKNENASKQMNVACGIGEIDIEFME